MRLWLEKASSRQSLPSSASIARPGSVVVPGSMPRAYSPERRDFHSSQDRQTSSIVGEGDPDPEFAILQPDRD